MSHAFLLSNLDFATSIFFSLMLQFLWTFRGNGDKDELRRIILFTDNHSWRHEQGGWGRSEGCFTENFFTGTQCICSFSRRSCAIHVHFLWHTICIPFHLCRHFGIFVPLYEKCRKVATTSYSCAIRETEHGGRARGIVKPLHHCGYFNWLKRPHPIRADFDEHRTWQRILQRNNVFLPEKHVITTMNCQVHGSMCLYVFVPLKEALGTAGQTKRPTSCVHITPSKKCEVIEKYDETYKKVKSMQVY